MEAARSCERDWQRPWPWLYWNFGLWLWPTWQNGCSQAVTTAELTRTEAYFSGHVQGVGFRYSTSRLAQEYQVGGFVKNLADGRVHVVVEGNPTESRRFLKALQAAMSEYVTHVDRTTGEATGEFHGFDIRH
jgi:acylphosphatase